MKIHVILVTALIFVAPATSLADRAQREHDSREKVSLSSSLKNPENSLQIVGKVQLPKYMRVKRSRGVFGRYHAVVRIDDSVDCTYSPKRFPIGQYLSGDYKLYFKYCSDGESSSTRRDVEGSLSLLLEGRTYFGRKNIVVKANFMVENAVSEVEGIEFEDLNATEGQILKFNGDLWVPADMPEVIAGEKGDRGEVGPQGERGEIGATGAVGPQGLAGVAGAKGDKGDKGDTGLTGPQGAQGPAGVAGIDGAKGEKGDTGAVGPQGPQGIAGVAGAQGLKGDKGDKGDTGATGSQGPQGIQGLQGEAGARGATGLQGIAGVAGKDGKDGLDATVNLSAGVGITGVIENGEGTISVDVGVEPGKIVQVGADGRLPASLIPEMPAAASSEKVAFLKDIKPSGTHGGDCTAGAYAKRDLNSVSGDSSFVSILNNQFTLEAGTYRIDANAPGYLENIHKAKLVNVTSGQDILYGSTQRSHTSYGGISNSIIMGEFTIASTSSFEIQHRCTTSRTIVGFGVAASFGDSEVYTQVKIVKVK